MTTQLAYKSVTQPRDDHFAINPVTNAVEQFLLLNRTHYWTLHGQSGNSGGEAQFSTLTGGQAGPDGLSNATLVAANTQNVYHGVRFTGLTGNDGWQGIPGEIANGQMAFYIAVKAGTMTQVDVWFTVASGTTHTYRFDLSTGTRLSGPNDKVRIKPMAPGNPTFAGWYLIYSVNLRVPSTLPYNWNWITCAMVKAGNNNFTGTGAENFYYSFINVEWNVGVCSLPKNPGNTNWFWGKSDGEDQLYVALPTAMQTPQPLTVYMEWLDWGNAAMAGAAVRATTPGIFRIGNLENTGNNYVKVTQTATGFTGVYNSNGATSTSDVAITVDADQLVSLRAVINDAGALQIFASVNGAAEVSGTLGTSIGFPAAWSGNFITPNSHGFSNTGDMALRKLHVLPGSMPISVLRN